MGIGIEVGVADGVGLVDIEEVLGSKLSGDVGVGGGGDTTGGDEGSGD